MDVILSIALNGNERDGVDVKRILVFGRIHWTQPIEFIIEIGYDINETYGVCTNQKYTHCKLKFGEKPSEMMMFCWNPQEWKECS